MFTESRPSGRTRAGFRIAGRKYQRTFDYAHEAVAWATEAEERAKAAAKLGQSFALDPNGDVVVGDAAIDEAGIATVSDAPTLAEYAHTWLTARSGSLSPNTLAGYATQIRAISSDRIGRIRLDEIVRADVDRWLTRQVEAGTGRPTINYRLKVVRMVLKYAAANRVVPGAIDATEGVKFLRIDLKEFRWLTWEEDDALLAAARSDEERAMILAGVDAGLRWEEALGLGVNCLDGLGNVVVRQTIDRQNRKIRPTTKSGKDRAVPLTDRLESVLVPLIDRAKREGRHLVFSTVDKSGNERPVEYWNWRRDVWRPICHVAGVNRRTPDGFVRLRFHDLRHTFGTRLAQASVPTREIMELMGHGDEKTTARYVHAGNAARRAALMRNALRRDSEGTVTPIRPQDGRKSA